MTQITKALAFTMSVVAVSMLVVTLALAQSGPKPIVPSASASTPDQTTASFGDWTLRCNLRLDITPPQRFCESALVILKPGETSAQAQLAIGRIARGEPLRLTAVLPLNIAIKTPPKLVLDGKDPWSVELSWSRCLAGACFSDASATEEIVRKLRSRSEPGRIDYRDGTDREISVPVSFRGFSDALDALIHENSEPHSP